MKQTIAHLTDFSEVSGASFAHALALALAYRHRFYLLHVKNPGDEDSWNSFPHIRAVLVRWGIASENLLPSQIEAKFGIQIAKVEIESKDIAGGTFEFMLSHRPDLIVLSTRGREGLSRLLYGSKAEEIARRTHVPAIFVGPNASGFVDENTGQIQLRRILVPIAHSPSPLHSLHILAQLLAPVGVSSEAFQFLHVGDHAPKIAGMAGQAESHVEVVQGPIEETILRVAQESEADMIAMPTAGHHGFLDALRGSTTERILRRAPCPVLAIPAPAVWDAAQ